jgi:flagellar biosynthesis protein FlhF
MSTFRTFRAPDTRSALAMVKAALGADAVILSTREVSNGLFKPKEIEVTAALPQTAAPAVAAQTYTHPRLMAVAPPLPQVTPAPAQPVLTRVATPLMQTDMQRALAAAVEGLRAEPKPAPQAPPPVARPLTETTREGFNDELMRLRESMDEMRREVRQVTGQVKVERELRLPPAAAELYAHLLDRGIEDALAKEVMNQVVEVAQNDAPATLLAGLRNALSERLVAGRAPWLAEPGRRRIIGLVGPTGVGKTTTLAKIAARAIMESKLKVALITVDTYRIGAADQVTRYGEIMNVPTSVARDRVELTRAIEKYQNFDLILVDSAGRSVSEAVARQAEMLRSIEGISLYLVISACTGPREMAAAAERYRALQPERLIVTKIDEAVGPGSVLSASVRIGRPVVAVADGQRVPEDIHALSNPELIELIVGQPPVGRSGPQIAVGGR